MFWDKWITEQNLLDRNKKQTLEEWNLKLFRAVYLSSKASQIRHRMHFSVYRDTHTHIIYTYIMVDQISALNLCLQTSVLDCMEPRQTVCMLKLSSIQQVTIFQPDKIHPVIKLRLYNNFTNHFFLLFKTVATVFSMWLFFTFFLYLEL